ncbi:MAG: sodium:calcium antiporter, partial [Candidatus Krumholzibacteriia bacterium]
MILSLLLFAAGVAVLIGGAWVLVVGGTRVAAALGVPAVVVGLTVVAFGTSAPELFVSLMGALRGNSGIALGNVIGSNVANLGLILGLAAVLQPVKVEAALRRREVPLMLVLSV